MVSLANNHVGDFGAAGVLDTMAALDTAGIAHCGAGPDDDAARRPVTVQVGEVKVGFLSVMQRYDTYMAEDVYAREGHPGPALLHLPHLTADLARLRAEVDLSVVLVHWGRNYRAVTSTAATAGPRGPRGRSGSRRRSPPARRPGGRPVGGPPVLYSLGNAAFGTIGRFHGDRPPYGAGRPGGDGPAARRRCGAAAHQGRQHESSGTSRSRPTRPADRAFLQTLYEQGMQPASESVTVAPDRRAGGYQAVRLPSPVRGSASPPPVRRGTPLPATR